MKKKDGFIPPGGAYGSGDSNPHGKNNVFSWLLWVPVVLSVGLLLKQLVFTRKSLHESG
jgi:hypothetical protein